MNKILSNYKSAALLVIPLVLLFLGILNIGSFTLAAEDSYSEGSTSQTYYDYLINYKQKQANELTDFKAGIGNNVTDLKKDIAEPSAEVNSGEIKYSDDSKRSAILGSLSGSKGKLELDKSAYSQNPDVLKTITAITDTKPLEIPTSNKPIVQAPPPIITEPITPIYTPTCRQTAYGCVY